MAEHKVAERSEVAAGGRKLCEVDGRRFVLLHTPDGLVAFDNHCPHRGGPIGAGRIENGEITCPWHGLTFRLPDGAGCGHPATLTKVTAEHRDDGVYLVLADETARTSLKHSYLVRYGAAAHVGRFESSDSLARRGDQVLLETDRGRELGEVLAQQSEASSDRSTIVGCLLRRATPDELAGIERRQAQVEPLMEAVKAALQARRAPTQLLDAEFLFDGEIIVVYHLGPSIELLGQIAGELGEQHGHRFQFESLASDPDPLAQPSSSGAEEVKGPYERLKHDLRRLWECPVCGHHERWSGNVTTVLCPCQKKEPPVKQQWMKMVSEGAKP